MVSKLQIEVRPSEKKRVGLALGSGGGRGLAHLGVLRYFDEIGFRPTVVAGTSAGAIVAAAYACGRASALEYITENCDWRFLTQMFAELGVHRSGLISGKNVENFFHKFFPVNKIESLRCPYAAIATDFRNCKEVVISSGDLVKAIRASMSIPGMFTPVKRRGAYLVDGAILNPVPVSAARALGADVIIAVDVNLNPGIGISVTGTNDDGNNYNEGVKKLRQRFDQLVSGIPKVNSAFDAALKIFEDYKDAPTMIEIITQTTRIAENQMTQARILSDHPDILIQPAVGSISTLDFTRARDCMDAGYEAARLHHDEIKQILAQI